MATDDGRDPFDDLVLDEDFVRGGAYEPPARTRGAIARHAGTTSWRHDRSDDGRAPARRRRSWKRRVVTGVVAVLALAGGGYALLRPTGGSASSTPAHPTAATAPSTSSTPDAPANAPITALIDQTYERGACYSWNQRAVEQTAAVVPCTRPHLIQAVARETIRTSPASAAYPSDVQWRSIIATTCAGPVAAFLGYRSTSLDRLTADAIHPLQRSWSEGRRSLECTVGDKELATLTNLSDTRAPLLGSWTGDGRTLGRWWVPAAGTCAAQRPVGGEPYDAIVPCAGMHETEFVGSITLSDKGYPSFAAQADESSARCAPVVVAYAGHALGTVAGRYVTGWQIPPDSWAAGDRTVACLVAAASPAGKKVPLVGSVRAPVGLAA